MITLDDLSSILKNKGFRTMRLSRGHGHRDYLRMDQHFERPEQSNVAVRVTVWKTDDGFEGYINVYELAYRRTSGGGKTGLWVNEKRYSSPISDLHTVMRTMLPLVDEAMEDVRFRLLSYDEQEAIIRPTLSPDQVAQREANSQIMRHLGGKSPVRLNGQRRQRSTN